MIEPGESSLPLRWILVFVVAAWVTVTLILRRRRRLKHLATVECDFCENRAELKIVVSALGGGVVEEDFACRPCATEMGYLTPPGGGPEETPEAPARSEK